MRTRMDRASRGLQRACYTLILLCSLSSSARTASSHPFLLGGLRGGSGAEQFRQPHHPPPTTDGDDSNPRLMVSTSNLPGKGLRPLPGFCVDHSAGPPPEMSLLQGHLEWLDEMHTGLPRIPAIVARQMDQRDWSDLERILNVAPGEMKEGGDSGTLARIKGRSRLMTDYLKQRLVRLDNGTMTTVPDMFPRLFEEAEEFHNLQDGFVTRYFLDPVEGEERQGNVELVKYLMRIEDSEAAPIYGLDAVLWQAAEAGNETEVLRAIEAGADLHSQDRRIGRWTALHFAANKGREGCIRELLALGGGANVQTLAGHTPVHLAASSGHVEAVRMLVQGGGSLGVLDAFGDTPLHMAAQAGHVDTCRALVELGADLTSVNGMGDAPWQTSSREKPRGGAFEELSVLLKPVGALVGKSANKDKNVASSLWEGRQVVLVRGIKESTKEGDLVRVLGGKTRIHMVRIVRPKKRATSGTNGVIYALVRYRDADLAEKAVKEQAKSLGGRQLSLQHHNSMTVPLQHHSPSASENA